MGNLQLLPVAQDLAQKGSPKASYTRIGLPPLLQIPENFQEGPGKWGAPALKGDSALGLWVRMGCRCSLGPSMVMTGGLPE